MSEGQTNTNGVPAMNTQYSPTLTINRPANPGYKTRNGLTRVKRVVLGAALASFLGVSMFAGFGGVGSARAYEYVDGIVDSDGTVIEFYQNDDGSLFAWITTADGEETSYTFDDNPNPQDDNPSSGPMTPEALIELLKKLKGEGLENEGDFWGSELGKLLIEKGEGLIPVYNPSEIGQQYDDGTLGGGGFDPNGGDIIDQLRNSGGGSPSGGADEDDRNDDYGTGVNDDEMFDDFMVGPPELINPNPTLEDERTLEMDAERVG